MVNSCRARQQPLGLEIQLGGEEQSNCPRSRASFARPRCNFYLWSTRSGRFTHHSVDLVTKTMEDSQCESLQP